MTGVGSVEREGRGRGRGRGCIGVGRIQVEGGGSMENVWVLGERLDELESGRLATLQSRYGTRLDKPHHLQKKNPQNI